VKDEAGSPADSTSTAHSNDWNFGASRWQLSNEITPVAEVSERGPRILRCTSSQRGENSSNRAKFDLIVNLKSAKALGLAVPDKILALPNDGDRIDALFTGCTSRLCHEV
jgi:hypothetical protein